MVLAFIRPAKFNHRYSLMTEVVLHAVSKTFAGSPSPAVSDVSLRIEEGTLMTLLGPSGCGKSTLLRMIAGFESPDAGNILFDGRSALRDLPERRPTAMVFQGYALWPHKTVAANVAFGLRVRKWSKPNIEKRVRAVLTQVGLDGMADRYPRQLSGGQRQRVALARALAVEPKVFLLDEPLSNLDAGLRIRMRTEIRDLQRELGLTVVFVTHDQEEALSISDTVAVMNQGRIEQVGTPLDVYRAPATTFTASFIGRMNFLPATVARVDGDRILAKFGATECWAVPRAPLKVGDSARLAIRAEHVVVTDAPEANTIGASFHSLSFMGPMTRWLFRVNETEFAVDVAGYRTPEISEGRCYLHLPEKYLAAFPS